MTFCYEYVIKWRCNISCAFAETDIPDNLTSDVQDYWFWGYWSDGCFEKGEDPSAEAVYDVIEWYELEALNNDYFVDDEDDEVWYRVTEADYDNYKLYENCRYISGNLQF